MSDKKHILLDCDGVLLNPVLGFVKWILFNFPNIDIAKFIKNDMCFVDNCIFNYWNSPEFCKIPSLKDARYSVDYLKNKFEIDVISNCGNEGKIRDSRIKNLEDCFGKNTFKNIYTLPFKGSKSDVYNMYENTIIIDDELPNIIAAKDAQKNHQVFWMTYIPLIKKIIYDRYDRSLEKNFKKTNWAKIISYIEENKLIK
ncbi:MAG: hypothetical protein IJ638_03780 [Alphaproteobacteria bacterium]|nr:hypothetical protein [Alphaproteobacteria bacterium]